MFQELTYFFSELFTLDIGKARVFVELLLEFNCEANLA